MKAILKKLLIIVLTTGLLTLESCKPNQKIAEDKIVTETPISAIAVNKELLIGSWLDVSKAALHFTILKDGTARSDNMATFQYKKWRSEGNNLMLTVESIGNGVSFEEEEVFEIQTLTDKKMVLKKGKHMSEYTKTK